jgi:hypothetical protein
LGAERGHLAGRARRAVPGRDPGIRLAGGRDRGHGRGGGRPHPAPSRLGGLPPGELAAAEAELAATHEREAGGLERARALDLVDEVIDPDLTREAIARAIDSAPSRRGSHGNIPL